MRYSKLLKGGYSDDSIIKLYFIIIILGYLGVKIVYAFFFGFYPDKYYNRNIQINSNEYNPNSVQDIVVNAYVPGMWNNEISDFVTTIVLCYIIYVFTNLSTKNFVNENGNLELSFILGYIIGLGYPPIHTFYMNSMKSNDDISSSNNIFTNIYISIAIIFIIFSIILNFTGYSESKSKSGDYLIYLVIFFLLIFGLYLARKITKNYSSVTYFYNNGDNCTFSKNGIIQSSGDKLNITVPFLSFCILLLFTYQPTNPGLKQLYIFVYALLLGILVSGISYFGIEYFLIKHPQKECKNIQDCIIQDLKMAKKNNSVYNKFNQNIEGKSKNFYNKLKESTEEETMNLWNRLNNNLKEGNDEESINILNDIDKSFSEDMNEDTLKELRDEIKSKKKFSTLKLIILIIVILLAIYLIFIRLL